MIPRRVNIDRWVVDQGDPRTDETPYVLVEWDPMLQIWRCRVHRECACLHIDVVRATLPAPKRPEDPR